MSVNIHTRKQTTIMMRDNFRSNRGEATVAAAKAELGICIKSLWDVADDLKTGDVVHILPDYILFDDVDINIVFPTNKHLPLRNRMLLEFLVKELSGLIPA